MDQKEKLSKQRLLLNKRLGLDVAGGLGLAGDNLFSDEDLVARRNQTGSPKTAGQGQVGRILKIVSSEVLVSLIS